MIRSVIDRDLWTTVSTGGINSNSYDTALGFNMVRIVPNLDAWSVGRPASDIDAINKLVTGVMLNDFTYGLSSDWETMETPFDSGLGGILGGIGTASGGGEMGSVFRSKKYWKRSGYLEMTPQIRIIDIDGDGLPLRVARTLLGWSTAGRKDMFGDVASQLVTKTRGAIQAISKSIGEAVVSPAEDLNGFTSISSQIVRDAGSAISRATDSTLEDADDLVSLRVSPPPLIVEIGNVFKHKDMVLTQVEFSFSREFGEQGPLYVDATLTLSTRKMIRTIDDIGLYDGVGGNITIAGGPTNVPTS